MCEPRERRHPRIAQVPQKRRCRVGLTEGGPRVQNNRGGSNSKLTKLSLNGGGTADSFRRSLCTAAKERCLLSSATSTYIFTSRSIAAGISLAIPHPALTPATLVAWLLDLFNNQILGLSSALPCSTTVLVPCSNPSSGQLGQGGLVWHPRQTIRSHPCEWRDRFVCQGE